MWLRPLGTSSGVCNATRIRCCDAKPSPTTTTRGRCPGKSCEKTFLTVFPIVTLRCIPRCIRRKIFEKSLPQGRTTAKSTHTNMRQVMPTAENTFSSQPYHIHNNHTQDNHRHTPTADLEQRLPSSPLVTPPLNPTAMSASRNTAATETSTHRGSPTVRNERSPSDNNILTRRGVPHVYHDYARIPDEPALIDHTPQRKKSGGVAKPFPEKLHDMLDAETPLDVNQAEVVCWLPHGRAFIVRHPKIFTQVIMPKYVLRKNAQCSSENLVGISLRAGFPSTLPHRTFTHSHIFTHTHSHMNSQIL